MSGTSEALRVLNARRKIFQPEYTEESRALMRLETTLRPALRLRGGARVYQARGGRCLRGG